jgi:hypothetical protein
VRNPMQARAEHLAGDGLTRRQGPGIVPQRDLLATLRRRELDAVGVRLSDQIRMPYAPPAELVAGTFRQRLTLSSGRFAMIDNGLGFALVPWTPVLDRYLGRHITGVAKESGGIDWAFGQKSGEDLTTLLTSMSVTLRNSPPGSQGRSR